VGCFTVVKPLKVGEASGYECFSIKDAKTLILSTVSLTQLDEFSARETRGELLVLIAEQRRELDAILLSKRQANIVN
jgi:hypothetical protein